MSTGVRYIKTLGALTINDGNPDNPLDITTGGAGAITINGVPPGGGGGGGDVYKIGNNGQAGQPQTFSCPINVGTPGANFDLTVDGQILAEGNIVSKATGILQVQGELDLARSAPNTAAVITDGGKFEMRGLGGGAAVAELDPGSKSYTFGVDQASGATEATINVQGNVVVKDAATDVITLNGQQAGANSGVVQAIGFVAEGVNGNFRGENGGVIYAKYDVNGIDTTGFTAGNSVLVRTGAIGARSTHLSYIYDTLNNQVIETIPTAGNQKITSTAQALGPGGTGTYKLSTQTQRDTIFHMPPTLEIMNNYQMNGFRLSTDITIDVSDVLAQPSTTIFSLGANQAVWTSLSTVGTNVVVTPTPYNGTSIPFGRYRLILQQKVGPVPADDVWAQNVIQGLHISDELLYTGLQSSNAAEFTNTFTGHRVDFSFSQWSGNAAAGKFPPKANTEGQISITYQSFLNGISYFLRFKDWDVTTLQQSIATPRITFEAHLITEPML